MSEWRKLNEWNKGECDDCGNYRWHLWVYVGPAGRRLELCNDCGSSRVSGDYYDPEELITARPAPAGSEESEANQ